MNTSVRERSGFAALLKIYPMAAMMIDTLRRPPKQRQLPYCFTVLVIVLLALQWRDSASFAADAGIEDLVLWCVLPRRRKSSTIVFDGDFRAGVGLDDCRRMLDCRPLSGGLWLEKIMGGRRRGCESDVPGAVHGFRSDVCLYLCDRLELGLQADPPCSNAPSCPGDSA